jgi:hypothetical protein
VAVGTRITRAIRAAIAKYTSLFIKPSSFYLLGFSIYEAAPLSTTAAGRPRITPREKQP